MSRVGTSVDNLTTLKKFFFRCLFFLAAVSLNSSLAAENFSTSRIFSYAPDPAGYSLGFARAHWAQSINKEIVFFGGTRPATDDNSIRAYDPVTNNWEYLWSNDPFNGGLQTRDNHASLYVPRLDELWVWGGSHLETLPGALRSGRFSVAQKKWITTSTTDEGAFSAVVQNFGGFLIDPAMTWSEKADMGLMFGGSDAGNPSNRYWIIEPNPAGPQPYKMSEVIGGVRPPPRAQAMNLLVSDGEDFYLLGGFAGNNATGQWTFATDLWKFSVTTKAWTQLPPPPNVGYASVLTYDSDQNVLVAWVDDKIYVFDLATRQWSDQTPLGLPCIFNQVGVYAPTAKLHLFEGGNDCATGNSSYMTLAISLSGAGLAAPAQTAPPSPPPPSPPAATSALNATPPPPPADTTPPNVSITSPANTATVSGTITILANASDNVGVVGVQFRLDGTSTGSEVTAVPYTYSLDTTALTNGSHSLTAVARDAAGNKATSTVVSVTVSNVVAMATSLASNPNWLNIPLRTWVSRPLPHYQLDVRNEFIGQRGYGPSPDATGSKHQRVVYNPDNTRVYFYSGDFSGPPFNSSFHTDMFSYDITNPDLGDYQNWILEWPYCGLRGQVSPVHTDEAPFTWDSKRHVFWITGGFESSTEDVVSMCANGAITYGNSASTSNNPVGNASHGPDILQFDPAQNRYIRPAAKYTLPANAVAQDGTSLLAGSQMPRHSVYNPVTDEIIMMGQSGGWGNYVIRMNAETGAWTRDGGGIGGNVGSDAIDGGYINDTSPTHEQLALDVEHQWIYWIDTYHKTDPDPNHRFRLMRYDITNHNMVSLGWIQLPNFGDPLKFPFYSAPYDSTMLVYDSINKVVLWPASSNEGRPILMIYHPDQTGGKNGAWEIDAMNRDKPNEIIFGSNGTFIPELNVMVIYGGFGTPNSDYFASACPGCSAPENYFWLYRYGNGSGQPFVPVVPPIAATPSPVTPTPSPSPSNTLHASYLGVTGEDKVGPGNQTTPNGKADFHVSVSGLRGIPTKVTITSDTGGVWETPFNGTNWIIATQYDGNGNGDFWFEQYASNKFHVKVRYSDGTTDEADATNQNTTLLPLVSLSPVNLTFGNQIIGTSTALQQVSLSNSGNAPLSISGITITGDFSQSSTCPSTLAAGTQCTVSVNFQPLVIGPRTGILSVSDNAAGSPHNVNLTGIGATPIATDTTPPSILILSPAAGASVSKTVTVTATATDNIGIAKIELYKDGVLVGMSASSPYGFGWDTTKDSNGAHTLIAMAYDAAGNSASTVISLNVANTNTPPSSKEISIVFQEGLNGYSGTQDTYFYYYYHWLNFGSASELLSGEGGGSYTPLVRYAIFQSEGGTIPMGTAIKSATLSLYKYSPYDQALAAYRVLKDWKEMDASWDNANATTPWSNKGAYGSDTDVVATPDGEGIVGWDPGWLEIDVTSGVQAMSDGAPNYGWHLVGISENALRFFSREYTADPTLRPKLTIVYTEPAQ